MVSRRRRCCAVPATPCNLAWPRQHQQYLLARLIRSRAGRREFFGVEGVFRHFQIIEDEAGFTVESAHGRGDAVGFGANDADGEASQAGGVLGAVAGSDAAAVLVPAAVEDVMGGLDGPVSAVQREQALGAGGVGGMAGDAVGVLDGLLAGGFGGDGALDEEGLADMGEGEVIVECRGGPDGAAFDASVAQLGPFLEVGFAAFSEVDVEVGQQVGPIALDGEQVVRAAADEEVGELCLGEQGSAVKVLPARSDSRALSMGMTAPILVGALGLFAGADGQAAYFFFGCGWSGSGGRRRSGCGFGRGRPGPRGWRCTGSCRRWPEPRRRRRGRRSSRCRARSSWSGSTRTSTLRTMDSLGTA